MNIELMQLFSKLWNPWYSQNQNGGASSREGTENLRTQILALFEQHKIKSIFDSGCNDCGWMFLVAPYIQYQGGDISVNMVNFVKDRHPDLHVVLHDITTDPIPSVDLLFSRDVAIHLNNQDKKKLWSNWFSSGVPWILITHNVDCERNQDFEYGVSEFPCANANWEIEPWSFPVPVTYLHDSNSNSMALWHRTQFERIL